MINHLLLIGIDEYLYQKPLNNCVKDVKDFKDLALEKFDFEESNVTELYDKDATNFNIQNALKGYGLKLTADDNLVIFFSGHGHYDGISDRGFWVPVEATSSFTAWIPNDVILALIERIPCRHIFIISDSCFSNQILVPHPTKTIGEYANRKSRWALTSAFQEAWDSEVGKNGPFAAAILQFLHETTRDFRIGELIEYVKTAFHTDKLQSPQGSPLYCKGNSGGEMVFNLKRSGDNRSFRGYNDFLKVLRLYKRNSQFHHLTTHEDSDGKIGFHVYHEVDSVVKKATYYLYLYQGISITKTYNYLLQNHSQIFRGKTLVLLLSKETTQEDRKGHLESASNKFKPISAFYIDDFIRQECTPKIAVEVTTTYLSISNFVVPSFANGLQARDVKKLVDNWFSKLDEPIMVLKGTGGIGKTTFAQYVADEWFEKTPNTTVMFIDSVQIKDILIRTKLQSDGLGIYDFYDAFWQSSGGASERLTEELFSLNIDAGNILLVIDGLDEVISKVASFDVDIFLSSINASCKGIGNGKVLITCRTQFWEKSETESLNAKVLELEPFSEEQAKIFFEKSLDSNNKVRKAMKMADQFKYPGSSSSNVFHPYVLDIIRSIITLGHEVIDIDMAEFSSKHLSRNLNNDYIIYRVCDRERKRVGQISVDDQVAFFIYLATEKRGAVKSKNLREFVEEALSRKINATSALALISHPFLGINGDSILFKYDFLGDMFKGMYVSSFLDLDTSRSPLPDEFLQVVEENCWYGSGINSDIVSRMRHWNEYDVLLLTDYIKMINDHTNLTNDKKVRIVGSLFGLALQINQRFGGSVSFPKSRSIQNYKLLTLREP